MDRHATLSRELVCYSGSRYPTDIYRTVMLWVSQIRFTIWFFFNFFSQSLACRDSKAGSLLVSHLESSFCTQHPRNIRSSTSLLPRWFFLCVHTRLFIDNTAQKWAAERSEGLGVVPLSLSSALHFAPFSWNRLRWLFTWREEDPRGGSSLFSLHTKVSICPSTRNVLVLGSLLLRGSKILVLGRS